MKHSTAAHNLKHDYVNIISSCCEHRLELHTRKPVNGLSQFKFS